MNTLKYSLEYHCYPIWNYTEDGELVDNDLPAELRDDTELNSMLLKIQKIFDSLFTDTSHEDYGLPGSTCPDFGKHDSGHKGSNPYNDFKHQSRCKFIIRRVTYDQVSRNPEAISLRANTA